jgi:hypothetical protein
MPVVLCGGLARRSRSVFSTDYLLHGLERNTLGEHALPGDRREEFGQRTLATATVPATTPRWSVPLLRSSLYSRLELFA